MPSNCLIIVAGGLGSRMNNNLPKQFIKVNGKEIITHTIHKFRTFDSQIPIVVAVHKDFVDLMNLIIQSEKLKNIWVCVGGNTRYHSVKNALDLITHSESIVGIHDAARPLVSLHTIKNCFNTAAQKGNATPAISVNETIRHDVDGINTSANRNHFKIIQTPQCFLVSKIKKAFEQPYSENFTDDASVLEASGEKIILVEGNTENIKITNPQDLIIAKALLENEQR